MIGRRIFTFVLTVTALMVAQPAAATPGDTLWTKTYDGPASGTTLPAGSSSIRTGHASTSAQPALCRSP